MDFGFEMIRQGEDQRDFLGIQAGYPTLETAASAAAAFEAEDATHIAVLIQAPEDEELRPDPHAWRRVA